MYNLFFNLLKFQAFFLVFQVIVGKQSDESRDFVDSVLRVGRDFAFLKPQHHRSVERVEAGFDFVLIFVASVAQFHDEGQHLIILGRVEREFRAGEQLRVEFGELLHNDLVDLQVSALALALAVHHRHEVAVPVGQFVALFVVIVELGDVFASQARQRTVVGADDVLDLPHIKQIFSDAFLS